MGLQFQIEMQCQTNGMQVKKLSGHSNALWGRWAATSKVKLIIVTIAREPRILLLLKYDSLWLSVFSLNKSFIGFTLTLLILIGMCCWHTIHACIISVVLSRWKKNLTAKRLKWSISINMSSRYASLVLKIWQLHQMVDVQKSGKIATLKCLTLIQWDEIISWPQKPAFNSSNRLILIEWSSSVLMLLKALLRILWIRLIS